MPAGRVRADEPLGALLVGGVEHVRAELVQLGRGAVTDGSRGHQPDLGVAVLVVIPVEEPAAVIARLS